MKESFQTYFLDFDRTLFDVDAFEHFLANHPGCADLKMHMEVVIAQGLHISPEQKKERGALWAEVARRIESGTVILDDRDMSPFVFSDVSVFLKQKGQASVIVTEGHDTLQKAKIKGSGLAGAVRDAVILPKGTEKGIAVKNLMKDTRAPYVFVDDWPVQLDSVSRAVSDISIYEIRRDGKGGCGRYPVIRSLAELP